MDVRERLLGVVESVLGPQTRPLSDDDGPRTVAGWDSVAHLHLILAVEQEFSVHFDSAEIPQLLTLGTIRTRIEHRA